MREEFLTTRSGKTFVLFAGLLDEAHKRGLSYIETQLVQIPTQENGMVAICKAWVEVNEIDSATGLAVADTDGVAATIKTTGIGDASPENVGRNIVPHIIRMSETRAKARALRDAVNVGVAALEELSDDEPTSPQEARQVSPSVNSANTAIPIGQGRQARSERDEELTPGGVPIWKANEVIDLLRKAGHKREEVAPYIWKASPEAVEKKMKELKGKGSTGGAMKKAARKSQKDLLRTLAEEFGGENGTQGLEERIGKPIDELSTGEANEWIDRLSASGDSG